MRSGCVGFDRGLGLYLLIWSAVQSEKLEIEA